jgi:hypothetical protein
MNRLILCVSTASLAQGEDAPYTLEDVVEAVRNCNNRNSARAYLTQECSTCLSLYPMSKVLTKTIFSQFRSSHFYDRSSVITNLATRCTCWGNENKHERKKKKEKNAR